MPKELQQHIHFTTQGDFTVICFFLLNAQQSFGGRYGNGIVGKGKTFKKSSMIRGKYQCSGVGS